MTSLQSKDWEKTTDEQPREKKKDRRKYEVFTYNLLRNNNESWHNPRTGHSRLIVRTYFRESCQQKQVMQASAISRLFLIKRHNQSMAYF